MRSKKTKLLVRKVKLFGEIWSYRNIYIGDIFKDILPQKFNNADKVE